MEITCVAVGTSTAQCRRQKSSQSRTATACVHTEEGLCNRQHNKNKEKNSKLIHLKQSPHTKPQCFSFADISHNSMSPNNLVHVSSNNDDDGFYMFFKVRVGMENGCCQAVVFILQFYLDTNACLPILGCKMNNVLLQIQNKTEY